MSPDKSLQNNSEMDEELLPIRAVVSRLFEEKISSFFMIALSFFLSVVVWEETSSWLWSGVVFFLLQIMLFPIYFPIHYALNNDGIECWSRLSSLTLTWSQIRYFKRLDHGVLLFPQNDPYPLDALRGCYLPLKKTDYSLVIHRLLANNVREESQ